MTGKSESYSFNADIQQLMSLIINAFYSNKEIFLRELVSNASDALDKIRYKSLTDESVLNAEPNLEIRISSDSDKKLLFIEDTGIGMTKDELIKNLGTIARSGTKAFMEALESSGDISMIGQFGVGFYSAFLVADRVVVVTKHPDDKQCIWESSADGSFSVTEWEPSMPYDVIKRGTRLILHLKEDQVEYTQEQVLKDLIKKHSAYLSFPIKLACKKTKSIEVELEGEELEAAKKEIEDKKASGEEIEVPEKFTKNVEEQSVEFDVVNTTRPLISRKPEEITSDEYADFYKSISNDWEKHLSVVDFNVEGSLEFRAILYIPRRAPFDLFDTKKKRCNIKLFVRKVFITDDCEDLIPEYLSFVKGIVNSEDLPLNISREQLQAKRILSVIKKNLVKKCIEEFERLADVKEDFKIFYEQFSKNIKLGVHEDNANRKKLIELLRFHTTKSGEEMVSIREYVDRMPAGQKDIYYICGESRAAVENSPFIETLKQKNLEVLLMVDPLDEYVVQQFTEYDGKKCICVTKEGMDLLEDEEEKKKFEEQKEEFKPLCETIKSILDDKVEKVVCGTRISASPCVLVTPAFGWSANMERIMKAQALRDASMSSYMISKRTMEINMNHPIMRTMKERLAADPNDKTVKDLIWLLYDTALLTSGFTQDDPTVYANRIFKMIKFGLSINDESEEVVPGLENLETSPELISKMEEVD